MNNSQLVMIYMGIVFIVLLLNSKLFNKIHDQ